MPDRTPETPRPPVALRVVVVLLVIEALTLLVVAGLSVRDVVTGDAVSAGLAVGVVVVSVGVGVVLVAAGRALLAGRRWGRAPALTWQLLQLTVAVPALLTALQPLPALLLLASVVVGIGLFHPTSVRHTTVGGTPPTL